MFIVVYSYINPEILAKTVFEIKTVTFWFPAVGLNTVSGIKQHMISSGVDKSEVLGVVEEVRHVKAANDWLISIQDDMLVPFGAIHPDMDGKSEEIIRLREAGIKGIKLHPMVNQYYPDDPRMFEVYEELGEDMVVEIHSGRWAHTKPWETVCAEPSRIRKMIEKFTKMKDVALHLGGFYMLDEAERELIGQQNILIDTTWPPALKEVGERTMLEIVNMHGSDNGCFGTDFPLADMAEDAKFSEDLPLPGADKERILGENARAFIGL